MSILTSIFQNTIGRVLPSSAKPRPTKDALKTKPMDRKTLEPTVSNGRRKREDSNDFEERFEIITKRLRVDEDRYAPIVNGEIYESAAIEGSFAGPVATTTQHKRDRALMPPPSLSPLNSRLENSVYDEDVTDTSVDIDNTSLISQRQKPLNEFSDEYSMEKARRHALATTLPLNSGVWDSSERDLFFHLSYRGFEPLFPGNWMHDFETLPLTVFSNAATAAPLIQAHQTKEFRAIRELRELVNLGKTIRDKVLASPAVKTEIVIEKATKKYISWALLDVGIRLPSSFSPIRTAKTNSRNKTTIPIHTIVKLKHQQTTQEVISELKHKLHALASRHRQAQNIHQSIECDYNGYHTPATIGDETQVLESSDNDLPVLYGILICRSVVAIFTMNSQIPLPRGWQSNSPSHSPAEMDTQMDYREENLGVVDDSASDPRFISDFDFSDCKRDVWNAFAIAIVAMQIRKDMLLLRKNLDQRVDPLEEVTAGIEDTSVIDVMEDDDDDPDL